MLHASQLVGHAARLLYLVSFFLSLLCYRFGEIKMNIIEDHG